MRRHHDDDDEEAEPHYEPVNFDAATLHDTEPVVHGSVHAGAGAADTRDLHEVLASGASKGLERGAAAAGIAEHLAKVAQSEEYWDKQGDDAPAAQDVGVAASHEDYEEERWQRSADFHYEWPDYLDDYELMGGRDMMSPVKCALVVFAAARCCLAAYSMFRCHQADHAGSCDECMHTRCPMHSTHYHAIVACQCCLQTCHCLQHVTNSSAYRPGEGLYNLRGDERRWHFAALFEAADISMDGKLDVVELRHLLNPHLSQNHALQLMALNMTIANELCAPTPATPESLQCAHGLHRDIPMSHGGAHVLPCVSEGMNLGHVEHASYI